MKKRTVISIFTFLLVAAVVAGTLAALSDGFKNWDVMTWFNNCTSGDEDKTTEVKSPAPVTDGNGNALDSDKVYPLPRSLYFSSSELATANAPQTVTVKVNPKPVNTDFPEVDWSVAWSDPSHSTVNRQKVTDYVTVTPQSEGSTTATISFIKVFPIQILLTCKSQRNENISVITTIDCYRRPTFLNLEYVEGGCSFRKSEDASNTVVVPACTEVNINPEVAAVGSLTDEFDYLIRIGFTDGFLAYMKNHSCDKFADFGSEYGTGYGGMCFLSNTYKTLNINLNADTLKELGMFYPLNMDGSHFQGVETGIDCFVEALKEYYSQGKCAFKIEFSVNGQKYGLGEVETFYFKLDTSLMVVEIEGLEFENGSIVF